ncbi:hypothetical protein [Enterococcus rivorum]|uniref:hypothetical protein n=1 Tax=Enterococcus rivorum TaxID=762845 RepID=UPI0014721260|nr:hypothetical protein [Enterococcus rivorum]MBP2098801.1 hypothetical protein [Enterococcus rivorum]
MDILKNMTKAKKDEVRKKVKEMMEKEGIVYEDWLLSLELDYLLNNLNVLSQKQGGHHQ